MNHDTKEKIIDYINEIKRAAKDEMRQENGFDSDSYAAGVCRGEIATCNCIIGFIEEVYK